MGLGLRPITLGAQSTSGCWGGTGEHPWVQGRAGLVQLSVLALPHLSIYFLHHRSSAVPLLSNWGSLQQSTWVAASFTDGSHPARKNRDKLVFLLWVASGTGSDSPEALSDQKHSLAVGKSESKLTRHK